MPKITIDDEQIEVNDGLTVLQACKVISKEIPYFCYHERLKIAGNCRMCLVELEKSPKLIASCSMPVQEGMVIHTNTEVVRKAREGVMEFLLINHPLDCPICDQGGECDLQDQAMKYGGVKHRFHENKRSIQDKYMGPLIKTHMTRCIHCTRCIRFATEIAGVEEIGALYRGEHMEITSYLEKTITSELSGNIIDLCPVGALTSKPYAFKARNWELKHTDSIDISDALGSNIRIDSRGFEVMRIMPRMNEDINEEWISDKARFSYDGLNYQRLDRPYIRKNDKLIEASWPEALAVVADKMNALRGEQMAAIAGPLNSIESIFLLKQIMHKYDCDNLIHNQYGYKIDTSTRGNYLFNTTIKGIDKADLCLLIGANMRHRSPVLNARIGQMVRLGYLKVLRIGSSTDQTYPITDLGDDINIIEDIAYGKHTFCKQLKNAKNPIIIVGDEIYSRADGYAILDIIHKIVRKYQVVRNDWNGFNILHNHASIVGNIDAGFTSNDIQNDAHNILNKVKTHDIKFVYLLGADDIVMKDLSDAFVLYHGHHGDTGASNADVIFPSAAYTEQDGMYVNLEGRVQFAKAAVPPIGSAKQDWMIINDLAHTLGIDLGVFKLSDAREQLAKYSNVFTHPNDLVLSDFTYFTSTDKLKKDRLQHIPVNYYMTDVISKHSVTMAKCSKALNKPRT